MSEVPSTDEESLAATRPRREIQPTQKVIEMEEQIDTDLSSTISGRPRLAQGSVNRASAPPKSKTVPAKSGRTYKSSQGAARRPNIDDDVHIKFVSDYPIYFWPYPRPTDFTALTESQQNWKRRADKWDKENDMFDGAEDWYLFDDTQDIRMIASNFVVRAKRAFWKGISWEDYVVEEMKSYSEAEARKACQIFLSNELRMKVWDSMERRLCAEIWSEAYRDPPGLVKLRVADVRRARKEQEPPERDPYTSYPPGAQPRSTTKRRRIDPRPDDLSRGIVGHTLDPDGFAQPFYEGEEEAPHGVAKDMAEWRTDRALESATKTSRSSTSAEDINGHNQVRRELKKVEQRKY